MAGLEGWAVGGTGYDMAVAVVTLMFALAGIALGTGIGFRIRWLQDWGRDKLVQAAINGAMVGALVLLFGSGGIMMTLMGDVVNDNDFVMGNPLSPPLKLMHCTDLEQTNGKTSPTCYALVYLTLLQSMISQVVGALTLLIIAVAFIASLKIDLVFVAVSPFSGLEAFVGMFSNLLQFLVMLLTMTWVQYYFVKFMENVAIPVLLPIGLILRSFFMTRKLGGALIAMALGLGVIFPLTFVLDGTMMTKNITTPYEEVNTKALEFQNKITELTDLNGLFTDPFLGIRVPDIGKITERMGIFADLFGSFAGILKGIVDMINAFIANMIFMVVILPFFNIIVTMVSIRELASLFGSEFSGGSFGSL